MKKTLIAICIFAVSFCALADTETIDGIKWFYTVSGNEAIIGNVITTTVHTQSQTFEWSASQSTYSGLASNIVPGSVTISSSNGETFTDNGSGIFTYATVQGVATATINYSTGTIYISSSGYHADCNITVTYAYKRQELPNEDEYAIVYSSISNTTSVSSRTIRFNWSEEQPSCILSSANIVQGSVTISSSNGETFTDNGDGSFTYATGQGVATATINYKTGVIYISFSDYHADCSMTVLYQCYVSTAAVPTGTSAIPTATTGALTIPTALGGYPVVGIGNYAFYNCTNLSSVTIPDSVTNIGEDAFYGCSRLKNVTIPQCVCATNLSVYFPTTWRTIDTITIAEGVGFIADSAFEGCSWLESITIPWTVTRIGDRAFYDCIRLREIIFEGDAPDRIGEDVFGGTQRSLAFKVPEGSIGWDGGISSELPGSWNGRAIATYQPQGGSNIPEENPNGESGNDPGNTSGNVTQSGVSLTVTNIVLHYVTQSLPSDAVIPPMESGIVNVVTEVGAGSAVAIPSDWAAQYSGFTEKFGNDFGAAITAQTGKRDGSGNPMFVWQDFVAGTDPTDSNDVFTASITFDATTGEPIISWSPELSAAEAAKRSYTTYGKVRLTDPDWTPVDGDEADYNFFKVEVKMK